MDYEKYYYPIEDRIFKNEIDMFRHNDDLFPFNDFDEFIEWEHDIEIYRILNEENYSNVFHYLENADCFKWYKKMMMKKYVSINMLLDQRYEVYFFQGLG